ncbi:hypothetical protein E2320_015089 [Naja naja]|nr:hypothetical protein E2320_015089 [Naja naja]
MQSLPISAAVTNHRTGPPPISPCKRRFSMDQGEDDLDCEKEHVPKMDTGQETQEQLLGKLYTNSWFHKDSLLHAFILHMPAELCTVFLEKKKMIFLPGHRTVIGLKKKLRGFLSFLTGGSDQSISAKPA